MKTHTKLQEDVLTELAWDPSIDASHIGVATQDGVVTLTGYVTSYAQKLSAENVIKRLTGVRALANDLEVQIPGFGQKSDTELAETCLKALEWDVEVPHQDLKIKVSEGCVTLEGNVPWNYQRAAAERAVRSLLGVKAVFNQIRVKPAVVVADVRNRIEAALRRQAELEAGNVKIETRDRKVVLKGSVHTWTERQQVENAAWAAPGVDAVENDLIVRV